jgi:DNA primase
VEGNFDVLTLHQAGIEETMAPMGTALTAEQVNVAAKVAKQLVLIFDGDKAGKTAATKSIPEIALLDIGQGGDFGNNETITGARVARLPSGKDPDDFIRTEGAERFRLLIQSSLPIIDHFIHQAAASNDTSIPGRLSALQEIASMLCRLKNQTARELYSGVTAGVLGLQPSQVSRAIREAAASHHRRTPTPSASAPVPISRKLSAEELHPVILLAGNPELMRSPEAARVGDLLIDPGLRHCFRTLAEQIALTQRLDVPAWLEILPPDVRESVSVLLMDGSVSRVADPAGQLRKLVTRLELLRVEAEMTMNTRMQKEAQARGDDAALRALAVRGIELRKTKEGLLAALQRP